MHPNENAGISWIDSMEKDLYSIARSHYRTWKNISSYRIHSIFLMHLFVELILDRDRKWERSRRTLSLLVIFVCQHNEKSTVMDGDKIRREWEVRVTPVFSLLHGFIPLEMLTLIFNPMSWCSFTVSFLLQFFLCWYKLYKHNVVHDACHSAPLYSSGLLVSSFVLLVVWDTTHHTNGGCVLCLLYMYLIFNSHLILCESFNLAQLRWHIPSNIAQMKMRITSKMLW